MLGLNIPAMVGYLHCLWYWALDCCQDGDLTGLSAEEISDGAMWEGNPEEFVQALINCGFGDRPGFIETTMQIHDWHEYAGKLVEKRKADAERKRSARRMDEHKPSSGRPADVPMDGAGNNQPTNQPTKPTNNHTSSDGLNTAAVFEHWIRVMGRNGATHFDDRRKKAVRWALKTYGLETCLRAIDGYAASDFHMGRDAKTGGKKHNDLTLIFRDADHAEKFLSEPRTACEAIDQMWGDDED